MASAVPNFTPAPDLDAILDRMAGKESSGNANAVGKKGEIGLLQVMPSTAKQYGVDPSLLKNPVVNRWVAKRYLTDLLGEFKGNLGLAIAGYNAGPGRVRSGSIPASTRSYVRDVLAGGSGPTLAASRPAANPSAPSARPSIVTQTGLTPPAASKVLTLPSIVGKVFGTGPAPAAAETIPIPAGASIGVPKGSKSIPIPHDATFDFPGPITMPAATPNQDPFAVRAAGYLPAVGQFGGELGGAALGAAIPGLGETGVPEAVLASGGGAGGSALGAEGENVIRRQYGLPPVSVGGEAAIGGITSGLPEVLPFVGRFRKAAAIAKATGKSYRAALDEVMQQEARLEGTLGMGPRKGKMLENAPATQVQGAYRAGKNYGLRELGQNYDTLLSPFYRKMTPNTAKTVFEGTAGRILDLTGKTLRPEVEHELEAEPMTVRRAQRVRSFVREKMRSLPSDQRTAREALGRVEKAITSDIKAVIGQGNGVQLDVIDDSFYQQMKRFPEPRALQKAYSEPAAAAVILKTAAGDEARTVDMIREMRRSGQLDALRRAVSTRIWQMADKDAAAPADRLEAVITAVKSVDRAVFDELYGKGAQKEWVDTARALEARTKELLEHPQDAIAIQAEVKRYLSSPTMIAHMGSYEGRRLFFDSIVLIGSYNLGELGYGIASVAAIEVYERAAHTSTAMKYLMKFATEKNPRMAAQAFIAFLNASTHAGAQATMAPTTPNTPPTPVGGPSATDTTR